MLSSTSEPTAGLEHVLAWQPSGSIIAASQRTPPAEAGGHNAHHVVFFERNGLRRYEFALREQGDASVVRELAWNAESTLLAVWIERPEGHVGASARGCFALVTRTDHVCGPAVQIWHRNNYHWYLKQEIAPRLSGNGKVTSVVWHPENGLELYLTTTSEQPRLSAIDTF